MKNLFTSPEYWIGVVVGAVFAALGCMLGARAAIRKVFGDHHTH